MSIFDLSGRRLAALAALSLSFAIAGVPAAALAADPITVAEFQLPPQDANGWTRLTPSSDSRLVYVDSQQGNDSTGKVYLAGDTEIGPDPQSPRGTIRPFRTMAAAQAQTREDQPDWLLLRSGRFWQESLTLKRGRSATERAVATSWGSGARPELRTGAEKGVSNTQMVNVAIIGIRFWAHTRDTGGPHFTGYAGSSGISVHTRVASDRRQVRNILVEDCVFRAYSNNVLTGGAGNGATPIERFVLRRSIISGNYATGGHSQGIFHDGSGQPVQPSILLQENLFDHNGWRIQQRISGANDSAEGQGTMFNHNTYFYAGNGVIFQGNLFIRASSIGNKWTGDTDKPTRAVVTEENLYVDGEIGLSIGGNTAGPGRFQDMVVRNNVITDLGRSLPSNRSLAWGIDLRDWNGGELSRNLVIHNRTGVTNAFALRTSESTRLEDAVISNNVFDMATGSNIASMQLGKGRNVVFRDNTVSSPSNSRLVRLDGGGFTFGGSNRYLSGSNQLFHIDGTVRTLAQWRSDTGDSGATTSAPAFPAPQRDLETYASTLGLDGFDGLLAALYGQSKANWNTKLTARVINNWLRAGYGMAPLEDARRRSNGSQPLAAPGAAAASAQPAAVPQVGRPATATATAAAAVTAPVAPAVRPVARPVAAPVARGPVAATGSTAGLRALVLRLLPFLAREDERATRDGESGGNRR